MYLYKLDVYAYSNSTTCTFCAKVRLEPPISRFWITVGELVAQQYVILETKNTSSYTVQLHYLLLTVYIAGDTYGPQPLHRTCFFFLNINMRHGTPTIRVRLQLP